MVAKKMGFVWAENAKMGFVVHLFFIKKHKKIIIPDSIFSY